MIEALTTYNLCTVYLLPLLRLNCTMFGGLDNFRNCYVTPEGDRLYVSVVSPEFCPEIYQHEFYMHDILEGTNDQQPEDILKDYRDYFIALRLHKSWLPDFYEFAAGNYREFSPIAKTHIRRYSGFPYYERDPQTGAIETDMRLLALETHPDRREEGFQCWDVILDASVPRKGELVWAPRGEEYKTFEPSANEKTSGR